MQIRKQGHCAYRCEYHLVLVSKYRRKIFNDGSFKYFQKILKQVWENIPEVKLLTINHDTDHIHMHLSIPPKVKVSDVVRTIKSITGRLLKKKFEYMRKAYWAIDGIWSDGYFVSTVGINEHVIKRYIEHQGQEDMGQAYHGACPVERSLKSPFFQVPTTVPSSRVRGKQLNIATSFLTLESTSLSKEVAPIPFHSSKASIYLLPF